MTESHLRALERDLRVGEPAAGGNDEQEVSASYLDNGLTGLRITYACEGNAVATEVVDLSD